MNNHQTPKIKRTRYTRYSVFFPNGIWVLKKWPKDFEGIPVIFTSEREFEETIIFYAGKTPGYPWETFKQKPKKLTTAAAVKWLVDMPQPLALWCIRTSVMSPGQKAAISWAYNRAWLAKLARDHQDTAEARKEAAKQAKDYPANPPEPLL